MKPVHSFINNSGRRQKQRGAVLVEFAFILPFLTLLILGIVDLGLLIRNSQIVQNAARETARYSSLPKNWLDPRNPSASVTDIAQRAVDYCAEENLTISLSDVTVDQSETIVVGGVTIRLSEIIVTMNHNFITPGAGLIFGDPVPITGRALFRNLF